MTLAQMQARFFEIKGKLAVGQIQEEEFKRELEKLRFQDSQGRWWMIGAQSGRWYYYDGARWLLGDPPDPPPPHSAQASRLWSSRRAHRFARRSRRKQRRRKLRLRTTRKRFQFLIPTRRPNLACLKPRSRLPKLHPR